MEGSHFRLMQDLPEPTRYRVLVFIVLVRVFTFGRA